jgi:hypothetical protein
VMPDRSAGGVKRTHDRARSLPRTSLMLRRQGPASPLRTARYLRDAARVCRNRRTIGSLHFSAARTCIGRACPGRVHKPDAALLSWGVQVDIPLDSEVARVWGPITSVTRPGRDETDPSWGGRPMTCANTLSHQQGFGLGQRHFRAAPGERHHGAARAVPGSLPVPGSPE